METEKLTVKDAMLYPNATLFWGNGKNIKYYNNVFEFVIGLSHLSKKFIPPCKLILRPIESLTEEEKKELIPCFTDSNYFNSKIINPYNFVNMTKYCFSSKIVFLIDKLSEWNIDFRGFLYNGKAVAE